MMLRRHVPHVAAIRLVVVGDRDEESAVAGDDRRPGAAGPSPDLVIVACADVDLDPLAVLGLRPGDAHLVTNAGGVVGADTVRDIAASRRSLGVSRVVVVQHEPCALLGPGPTPSPPPLDRVARLRASLRRLTRPPLSLPAVSVGGLLRGADGRVTAVRIT